MEKKLPKVFANKIEKEINNNENCFYSSDKKEEHAEIKNDENVENSIINESNIVQKINSIFNSPRYVYKANVKITTNDDVFTKRIIGKNRDNLITMENELIPISNIIDIGFVDE